MICQRTCRSTPCRRRNCICNTESRPRLCLNFRSVGMRANRKHEFEHRDLKQLRLLLGLFVRLRAHDLPRLLQAVENTVCFEALNGNRNLVRLSKECNGQSGQSVNISTYQRSSQRTRSLSTQQPVPSILHVRDVETLATSMYQRTAFYSLTTSKEPTNGSALTWGKATDARSEPVHFARSQIESQGPLKPPSNCSNQTNHRPNPGIELCECIVIGHGGNYR
jgi:hypothetical protein